MTGHHLESEGRKFRLSRSYVDWDDFKRDPKNFPVEESERMADAVLNTIFAPVLPDRQAVMDQMFEKQFPGFGCGQIGIEKEQLDLVAAFFVEIPRTRRNRILGYVWTDGQFTLSADFVAPKTPMVARAVFAAGSLQFLTLDRKLLWSDRATGN